MTLKFLLLLPLLEINVLTDDIAANEQKVIFHGKRADAIVKSMLQHSRGSSNEREPTDINTLVDECLRLSYHGMRARDRSFNCELKTELDKTLPALNVIRQDIGRVVLNLVTNALHAVAERRKKEDAGYEPMVEVSTAQRNGLVVIGIRDNGTGIPASARDKIFQPFFTTKPTGEGTGLGLSYDIVKAHGGELSVRSEPGEGSKFIVSIPVS